MPLGIELAAAWVGTHTVSKIAGAIEKSLDFLTTAMRDVPAHHRSLQAVFEHSWNLLGAGEREALQQLTVFRGGLTADAARHVSGADGTALAALTNKSLLYESGRGRFDMHSVLRQYAAERLSQRPEEATDAAARHAAYYAAFLEAREEPAQAGQEETALAEIGEEIENAWAGWKWAVAHADTALIGQAAGGLYVFCETRGWFQQGAQAFAEAAVALRRVLSRALDTENGTGLVLGRVLSRQAGLEFRLGHYDRAENLLESSLDVLHASEQAGIGGARTEVAFACKLLGNIAYRSGQYEEARRHYDASLTLHQELGDRWEIARCLSNLGLVAHQLSEYAGLIAITERVSLFDATSEISAV